MEPVSLAFSVVGLVALVSTCKDLIRTTESFLKHNKELSYYADLFRADRLYLELLEANEKERGKKARNNPRVNRRHSTEEDSEQNLHFVQHDYRTSSWDHTQNESGDNQSGTLSALDAERRAQIGRLLQQLEQILKSLELLLTSSESRSNSNHDGSREWRQRSKEHLASLKKKTVYSFGGRKTTIEEHLESSRRILSKVRLLHDVRHGQDLDSQMSQIDDHYNKESRRMTHERVRSWLCPDSSTETLEQHLTARVDQTCLWLFERDCWDTWRYSRSGTGPQFLWVIGSMGCGKSVLSATAIDHLRNQNSNVAFYFFSSQSKIKSHPLAAVRSMIWQLIVEKPKLLKQVQDKFADASDSATSSQVWEALRIVLQNVQDVFLVMDGFDECDKTDPEAKSGNASMRQSFLEMLWKHTRGTNVQMLLMSREESDIRNGVFGAVNDAPRLAAEYIITKEDVRQDLDAVASVMVNKTIGGMKEELKREISAAILDRSNGLFLWIVYQQDNLDPEMTSKELRDVVQAQPQELGQLFEGMWLKLQGRRNYEGRRAVQILRWLSFATRPLTVAEITEALFIPDLEDQDDAELAAKISETYVRKRIQGPCESLVAINASVEASTPSTEVHIFHDSVRDFLLGKFRSKNLLDNVTTLQTRHTGELCLEYLMKDKVWDAEGGDGHIIGSLKEYAAQNWMKHFKDSEADTDSTIDCLKRFFSLDNEHWSDWRDLYERLENLNAEKAEREYYAVQLGYVPVLEHIQNEGLFNPNQVGGAYGFPLQAACRSSHVSIAEALLTAGADVNAVGGHFGTALAAAAYSGSTVLVSKLLAHGARDIVDNDGHTAVFWAAHQGYSKILRILHQAHMSMKSAPNSPSPLVRASYHGHRAVVDFLIEHGADVNALGKDGSTPMKVAADNGHFELVALLWKRGANIHATSGTTGQTPLHSASWSGHLKIVQFLLEKNADPNVTTPNGWSPISGAAGLGHLEVVRALFDHGADINKPNKHGWTPLHGAAICDHVELSEFLIAKGASPNVFSAKDVFSDEELTKNVDGDWDDGDLTPLHIAANHGFTDIAKALVHGGANQKAKTDATGATPLLYAALAGRFATMEFLIHAGSNINEQFRSNHRHTTIGIAASMGYPDIVDLCMRHGFDINQPDGECLTPLLYLAVESEELKTVQHLLEKGADANQRTQDGVSPLLLACEQGSNDIAKLLVNKGAKFDIPGKKRKFCPLHHAVRYCDLEVVQLLLDKGADINIRSRDLWTPLQRAVETERLDIDMLNLLIANGADIHTRSKDGFQPIHTAAKFGSLATLDRLVTHGSPINAQAYNGHTALSSAVASGKSDRVKFLVERGALVNAKSNTGLAPLHNAASQGHIDCVKELIQHGASVNLRDAQQWTPLHFAAYNGYSSIVRLLISHCSAINAMTSDNQTPLYMAALKGHMETLDVLIEHGAWVNYYGPNFWPPLNRATFLGHTRIVERLLSQGASAASRTQDGWSAIHTAVSKGHLEIVKSLIQHGSAIDEKTLKGSTPLVLSASNGHIGVVNFLVEQGADINQKDNRGSTALSGAIYSTNIDAMKALLQHGAQVEVSDRVGETPLMCAARKGETERAELLLEKGADPRVANYYTNPTLAAASNGKFDMMKLLIERGSKINIPFWGCTAELAKQSKSHVSTKRPGETWFQNTALNYAAISGNLEGVKYLLEHGAHLDDVDARTGTCLRAAVYSKGVEMPNFFLNAGVDVHVRDEFGRSFLHCPVHEVQLPILDKFPSLTDMANQADNRGCTAAHYFACARQASVVEWAIDHDFDFSRLDSNGWSPLHWAAYFGRTVIIETLLARGIQCSEKDWQDRLPYQVAAYVGEEAAAKLLRPPEIDDTAPGPVSRPDTQLGTCLICFAGLSRDSYQCGKCRIYYVCFRCIRDVHLFHPSNSFRERFIGNLDRAIVDP